jgi:6-phosphogluconolactonase
MAFPCPSVAGWLVLASTLLVPTAALAAPAPEKKPTPRTYWVYIGTYTGENSKGIYRFDLDPATGKLTNKTLAAESASPSYLAFHPNGRFLYAVNEIPPPGKKGGGVSAFAIDQKTGDLTFLNQESSVGDGPCHLIVDKEGKHVLAANYGGGSTVVLPIDEKGRLGDPTDFVQHKGKSKDPARQEGPHAHCVALDAANRFAFVCDLGLDKVLIYKYDEAKGKLAPNNPSAANIAPGSGPRHIAFTPDGRFCYVVNELNSTMTAFAYDADHGALKTLQTLSTLPKGGFTGATSCAEVVVHPSGKFVFGSNRGQDSIATFAIDPKTGHMTYVANQGEGIKVPRGFTVDPTGTWAVVANQDSDSVVVFRIDPKTGELTPTGDKVEVGKPVDVKIMAKPE